MESSEGVDSLKLEIAELYIQAYSNSIPLNFVFGELIEEVAFNKIKRLEKLISAKDFEDFENKLCRLEEAAERASWAAQ